MTTVFDYMFRDGIYREAERAGSNANNGVTDDRYAMGKELPDLSVRELRRLGGRLTGPGVEAAEYVRVDVASRGDKRRVWRVVLSASLKDMLSEKVWIGRYYCS